MIWRHGGDRFDDRLVRAEDGEEIAVADDLDRPFGGPPEGGVVNGRDRRAAARLAHDTGMHHAVEHHVMNKCRFAKHLRCEVDSRRVLSDDAIFARFLGGWASRGAAPEIDGGGERPIIMAGCLPAMRYAP